MQTITNSFIKQAITTVLSLVKVLHRCTKKELLHFSSIKIMNKEKKNLLLVHWWEGQGPQVEQQKKIV